jgi:hypothetical protein
MDALLNRTAAMAKQGSGGRIRELGRGPGAEYDEETFLHLLGIEQARAERAHYHLRLLLATIEPVAGRPAPFSEASAAKVFSGLRMLLRDTDIMGWYRQGEVAGAVLTVPSDEPEFETASLIEQRVGDGLRSKLPSSVARSLRVRVTHHGPRRMQERKAAGARD